MARKVNDLPARLPGRPLIEETKEKHWDAVMVAYLETRSIAEVVDRVGLSRATVSKIVNDPDFQVEMSKIRREAMVQAITQSQLRMSKNVEALEKVRDNPDEPAAVRVAAAKALMDHADKWFGIEQTQIHEMKKIDRMEKLRDELAVEGHVVEEARRAGDPVRVESGSEEDGEDDHEEDDGDPGDEATGPDV